MENEVTTHESGTIRELPIAGQRLEAHLGTRSP